MTITVTDQLGQTMPLEECVLLCARCGSNDYSDPIAILLTDGETIVTDDQVKLTLASGEEIELHQAVDYLDRELEGEV